MFVQREHEEKLERTVEMLKLQEAAATKKKQELEACLSLGGSVGGNLQNRKEGLGSIGR